jgi:NAD(P)-dependent dehydrogenase (short-subunit alcohol dehydrogenase family)
LLARGAHVVLAGRSCKKLRALIKGLGEDGYDAERLTPVICDLADLDSVAVAVQEINKIFRRKPLDILVENAGIMPTKYDETPQGHEISFGTNVLGHFALRAGLLRGCLSEKARVIVLTGDIYVFSQSCSADFRWRTPLGGIKAYHRSKLGNFWVARELQRRYPRLNVFIVHPGVVATNLGLGGAVSRAMKQHLLIDPVAGAQTSLICATQPDLAHGSYYHNVHGEVELTNADPAMNDWEARQFWNACARLSERGEAAQISTLRRAS